MQVQAAELERQATELAQSNREMQESIAQQRLLGRRRGC